MSSKFSNDYPIPIKFPEILHDFTREVTRYMPKDILDFSIQYFYSLENNIELNYVEGGSKEIPKCTYILEQKEKSKDARETISTPSITTNQNTQNLFYKQNEPLSKKELDMKEIQETNSSKANSPRVTEEGNQETNQENANNNILAMNEAENENKESAILNKSGTTFNDMSANSTSKNGVRNFVLDVFEESKRYISENNKKIS